MYLTNFTKLHFLQENSGEAPRPPGPRAGHFYKDVGRMRGPGGCGCGPMVHTSRAHAQAWPTTPGSSSPGLLPDRTSCAGPGGWLPAGNHNNMNDRLNLFYNGPRCFYTDVLLK